MGLRRLRALIRGLPADGILARVLTDGPQIAWGPKQDGEGLNRSPSENGSEPEAESVGLGGLLELAKGSGGSIRYTGRKPS